ncbi:MAG: hypothetical protein GY925_04520, partial [Actinomycetia bacterium]|nr:hypothetical protein [Actinomycetes bacterium]
MTTKEINWVPTRALVNLAAEKLIVRGDPVPRPAGRPDPKNKEWIDHLAQVVSEAEFLGQAVTTLLMDRYLDGDRNQAHIWMRRLRRSALTGGTGKQDR